MVHPDAVGPGGKNRPYKAECLRESESHVRLSSLVASPRPRPRPRPSKDQKIQLASTPVPQCVLTVK